MNNEIDTAMVDDIVRMLDKGFSGGVGHVNIEINEELDEFKNVKTKGCADCSSTPLACSIPTMLEI
ncbi:MAG: hypothetical protein FWG91_05350 [Lachnospiraceae bacterium]|nr:hypothetical protein [Lachnospiraceae bacterium]